MKDTSPEIRKKQIELFLQKSPEERFLIGTRLIDEGRIIMESSIRKNKPGISDLDLKIEVLRRYYSSCFQPGEFDELIKSMIRYYNLA